MLKKFQKFNRRLRDDKNFRKELLIIAVAIAVGIIGYLMTHCNICGEFACHCGL